MSAVHATGKDPPDRLGQYGLLDWEDYLEALPQLSGNRYKSMYEVSVSSLPNLIRKKTQKKVAKENPFLKTFFACFGKFDSHKVHDRGIWSAGSNKVKLLKEKTKFDIREAKRLAAKNAQLKRELEKETLRKERLALRAEERALDKACAKIIRDSIRMEKYKKTPKYLQQQEAREVKRVAALAQKAARDAAKAERLSRQVSKKVDFHQLSVKDKRKKFIYLFKHNGHEEANLFASTYDYSYKTDPDFCKTDFFKTMYRNKSEEDKLVKRRTELELWHAKNNSSVVQQKIKQVRVARSDKRLITLAPVVNVIKFSPWAKVSETSSKIVKKLFGKSEVIKTETIKDVIPEIESNLIVKKPFKLINILSRDESFNVKSNMETACYSKILSHRVKSRKIKQKYIPKINLEGILEKSMEEIVEDLSLNLTFGEITCPITEPKVQAKEESIVESFLTKIPKVSKNFKEFKSIYIELKSKMYSKRTTVIKGIKKSVPYHLNLVKVMSEAKLRNSFSFDGRASIFAIRDAINYAEETEIWYEQPVVSYPVIEDFVDMKPLELWNHLPKIGRDWKNDKTAPVTKTSGISYIREQALKNKKNVNNFESSPFKQGNQKKKLADYLFEAKVFFSNNEVSNVRFGKYVVFNKALSYKSLSLKEIEHEMTANAFPMILSTFNDSLELRAYLIFWFGRFYKQKSSSDSSLVNWILYEFNSDNADYGKRKKFNHMILRETLIDQRLKRNQNSSTNNYEKLRKEAKERDALFASYAKKHEAERNPQIGWDAENKPIFKNTLFPKAESKSVNTYETTLCCKISLSMFKGIDSEIDINESEILYEPSIVEKIVKNRCETLKYGTSTGGMPEPHPGPEDHKTLSQESKLLLKRISKQQKKIAKGKQSQVITINQTFIDQVEAEVKRMEQLLLLSKTGKFDIIDTKELDLISKYIALNDSVIWDINSNDIELLSSVKGAKHIHSIVDRFTNLLNLINSDKSTYKIHISISKEEEIFEEDKIEKIEEETYFSNWNSEDIVTDLIDLSNKSNRNSSEFADIESNPGPQTIIPKILPEICNSIKFNQNELELLSVEPNRSLSIPFWKLMKENGINKVGNPVCGAASEMIAQVENNIEAVGWDVDSEYYELSRKLQRECKFKYLLRAYQTKEVTCISHIRYFDYNETDNFLYIDSQELWVDTIALGSNSDIVIIRLPVRTVFDFKPYGKMVTISMKQKEFCYNLFPITSKGNDMVNNIISNIEQFHKNEFNLGNIYHNLYENRDNRFQIQTGLTDDVSKMISYFMKEVKPQVETSEVYSWFKSFVTCVFGKYVSIGKQFFNQFAAEWEEDEFTAYCLTNDFSKTKQAIVVKCNGTTGYGFCYNGGFFTPYHINKGKPMSIGSKRMSPNYVSRTLDLVSFGKLAKLETIKEGAPVWVSRNSETVEGRVLTSNPLRVLFLDAVPVAGMSGLPMYNENFQPVGIYATHSIINDGKDFLSGPYLATDWTRKPLEALRTNDKVTVAVPCSRGKSTFLVKNCLVDYRCIVCLEPRIPLVQGLSEYVGGTGFSEKDEIDIQPGVNFITHGKFVFSAISNFTQNFKDVNLFIIDECHDPSPFMMWSRRFLMSIEGVKVLEATATPNNAKFLMEARNAMKYDVDINEIAPRVKESFDEKQVIELVDQYMKGKNFIIQVAAGSIGEKLIQQIKGRKGLCVTRAKFQEGLTVEAINEHLKEEGAYICATNVLNYGITLNVDAIIVMGDKYETTYTKENVSTIQKVPISQSEMNQWIGRVGRLKTGIAIIPEMINRKIQPELSMDDLITLELLDKLAGTSFFGNKFSSQIEHLSIPQIRSALQVPGAILNAISYVDINGNLIGKCEESLKLAKELGVSVIEEKVQKKLYLPSSANLKEEMLGPVTGLDINFPKEWHDAVFSDTVECGAGSFLFNSLIGCVAFQGFTSLLQELMPGCTESFEDCSGDGLFKEAPKLKTVNSTDFDMPLIVARMQNFLEADDIIETGLSDFLTSIWNWIRKYIINGCPSVSHRNVTVHCYEEDATMAQSAAYFLGGGGTFSKELNLFDDGSGEPFIFSDKQGIWKGVNFTEKGFEILNQVKTGSPFSIYSLFPYFTAIAYKLLPASVFIGLVITYIKLKYSSENKETDIGVMLNKLGSDISKDKLMKSPLGEKILCNAVIPSSFSLLLLGKPVMFVTNLLERLTSNIIKYLDENEGLDLSLGNFKLPIKSHSHLFKKINKQVKATNNFSQGFMVTTGMMEISTILLNICKLISGGIAIDAASNPHNMLIHAAVIALGTTGYFLGVTPLTYFGAGSCLGLGFSIVYDKIKEYYEWARIKLDNRVSCNLPLVSMIIGGISIPYGLEFLTGSNYLLLPCSMFLGWKLLTSLTQHYILGSCIVILSYFFKELYEHVTRREVPIPEVTYLVTNELVEPSVQVLIPYAIDEESYGAYDDLVEVDNETLNVFKVVSFTESPSSQVITFIFKEVQYVYNYFNKKLYIFRQIPLDTDIVLDYQLVGINSMHYMIVENKLINLFETFYVSKTVTRNGMLGIDLPDNISVFSLFSKENPNKDELKSIGALISVSLLKPMRVIMMKKGVPIGVFGNLIQETIIINFDKVFFMNFFRSAEVTLDVEEFTNAGVVVTQRQDLARYISDIEDSNQTTSVVTFGSIFMVASLTQFLGRFPSRYYNAVTYVTCVAGLFFDCLFNMGIPSLTGIITGQLVKSTISSHFDPVILDNWKWDINNPLFDQFKPKKVPDEPKKKPDEPKSPDQPKFITKIAFTIPRRGKDAGINYPYVTNCYVAVDNYKLVDGTLSNNTFVSRDKLIEIDTSNKYVFGTNLVQFEVNGIDYLYSFFSERLWVKDTTALVQDIYLCTITVDVGTYTLVSMKSDSKWKTLHDKLHEAFPSAGVLRFENDLDVSGYAERFGNPTILYNLRLTSKFLGLEFNYRPKDIDLVPDEVEEPPLSTKEKPLVVSFNVPSTGKEPGVIYPTKRFVDAVLGTYSSGQNFGNEIINEFEGVYFKFNKFICTDYVTNNLFYFDIGKDTFIYSVFGDIICKRTKYNVHYNTFQHQITDGGTYALTQVYGERTFYNWKLILDATYPDHGTIIMKNRYLKTKNIVYGQPTLLKWEDDGDYVWLGFASIFGTPRLEFPPEDSLIISTDVEDTTTTSAIGTSISLIILLILKFLKRQEPRVLEQSEGAEWSSRNVIHNMTNFTAKTMLFSSLSNFISTKFAIISAGFMLYPLVGSIFNLINMRNKEKSGIDHIQFGSDLLDNKAKPVNRSCESTSYVLGVAGDEVWYYRAALFIKNRKFDFPVQVVISDKDMEKAEIFKQFLDVTVIPVTIDHPSEIRCARLLPIFFGNPNELFLLRDADYIESELEMFSIQLSLKGMERVSSNSLRAGGPILAGVSNIYGLNNQPELAELFEDNKENWKKYGFDELFLLGLDNWDICIPNLSPSEQVIQWASARNTKGLNINIHSFHVRVNLNTMETKYPTDKLLVKSYNTADMTSMSNYLNFHMSQAQYFSICDYISKITCSQEVIDRYETHEDSKDRASTSFPLVQSFSLGMMVAMDSMVKSLYMFLLKHGYTEQLDQVKNNAVLFCGYILGNFSAVRQLKSAIKEGNLLCKEDNLVAKAGQNLLNQRKMAGTSEFKPRVAKPLQNIINLCSWIFNPVGSAAGLLMNYAFDIDKSIEMTMVGALMSTSNPCLVIAGIMKFIETETKSANETTNVVINVFTLLSGQVTTGKVEVLWTSPHIKKLCEFEIPWLNENITQYQKNFRRGKVPATIKYQNRTHSLVRPIGMISFRASMMYYLCRHNLINFRDGNILVLGSGKGGLIQGLLAGGISNKEITAVTLPESGWTTLPEVEYHASVNKVKLTTILADAFEADIESAEIVINDMMFQTDDELIQKTKFNILRDFHDTQAKGWRLACMLTKCGGTCIQSVHGHPIHRILQCVVECSLWFKEIRVMFEPANESMLKAWVICKRKRRLNYLPTVLQDPSDYRLDDDMNCIVYNQIKVNAIMKEILLYAENKEAGKEWCAYLNSNFKVPIITATSTVPYVVSNEPWGYLPSGLEEEIEWFKKARYKYYSKVPITQLMNVSNLPPSERFNILGYTERAPVQASVFNTGQDLLIARTLRINDLEDEILDFRVPDQSPFGQVLGLYKRYDFPLFENVCNEMIEAYDYLQGYVVEQAKGFDFSEYTQADLYEQVNTKSSLGYMSEVKEYTTKLKDLVLNHWNLIELERDRLLKSGVNNLTFHSATKIEKKLYKGESIQVPRIFMFRRGEVRCAEMLLTGRLNFFFGSSKKFFASSTGTIHNRYQTLGEAWETYRRPTALAIESMKWDGHVGIKVQVMARKIMIYAAEAGENGQNVADVIHSTCFHDCCGQAYLSNGYLVRLTGNVKSGLWCTSCGNKIVNTMIALASIKRTFPKLTFSEIREKFFLKIEGDDGIILGEYNDIEAILSNLPQVYEECGFPQDETYPVTKPALTSFCSHGFAKEQTTGKWLPMRNMREIFGRMVVPVSNNAFTLDLVMCARSLSVVISAVATFFHLRPVRDLFRILQAVIPKGVVPASCLPTERWKHLRDFGEDFKMLDFKLNTFASEILGQEVDVDLLRMNSSDLEDIEYFVFDKFNVENTIFLLKEEIETICSPTEFDKEAVWFSKDMTTQDVIKDLPWMLENGINDIVVETSFQLRDLYLHTDIPRTFKLSWMSAVTTMRKRTNKVHFYCHSDDIDRVKLSLDGGKNYNMNRGFKAESLYYERVVTSAPIILGICGSILALGILAYKFLFKKQVLKFTGQVTMMKFEEDEIPIEGKPYKLLCKEYKGVRSPRSQTLGLARTEGSKCLPAVALINNQILTVVSVEGKSVKAEFVFPKISNVHPDKREQLRNAIRESRQLDNIMPELGWCKQSGIYRVTATPGVGDLSRFKMHVANMAPYLPEGNYSFVMNSGDADLNDSILNSFGKNTIPCSNDYENLELSTMKPSFDKLVSNKNNKTKIISRINQVVFRGKPSGTTYCSRLKFRIELQNNPIEGLDFAFSSDQSWYEDDKNGNVVRKSTFGWIDKMSESDLLNYKALLLLPGYSGIGHIMKWMSHGMPIVVNHYDMPTGRLQEWFKTDFPELSCETIDECREIIKRIVKLDQNQWQIMSDKILMFHQIYAERIKRSTFTLCQQGIISENPPVTEVIPTVRIDIGRKVEYRDLYEPSYNHGTIYKPSSGIFMSEMKQDHGCGVAIYPLCEPDPNFDLELLTMEKNYKLSEISQKYGIPFNITNNMFNPHNEEYSFDKGNHFIEIVECNKIHYVLVHYGQGGNLFKLLTKLNLKVDISPFESDAVNILQYCQDIAKLMRKFVASCVLKVNFLEFELMYNDWSHDYLHVDEQEITQGLYKDNIIPLMGGKEGDCLTMLINDQEFTAHGLATGKNKFPLNIKVSAKLVKRLRSNCVKDWLELL